MIEKFYSMVACLLFIALLAGCITYTGGTTPEPDINIIETVATVPGSIGGHIATVESGVTMRVLWTVSGYKVGEGAAWGEEDAKALLFKPLDITDTEITFDNQSCTGVTFQQERVKAASFLASAWKTTPQDLSIQDQEVQVFKTNCAIPGFQEYIRLSDRSLIVPINGVFFFFKPAVTQ